MPKILTLAMANSTSEQSVNDGTVSVVKRDLYSLPHLNLSDYAGLILSGGCDQIFLGKHQEKLDEWIRAGGRILVNGHVIRPFLTGLPTTRKLDFRGLADVWLTKTNEHPIWEGIELSDVVLRTGVPGQHSLEELKKIGVAGFYARAYLAELNDETTVVTGIGAGQLPVDISYPLGKGEVIVHNGNDLQSFCPEGTSAENFANQIYAYMAGIHLAGVR